MRHALLIGLLIAVSACRPKVPPRPPVVEAPVVPVVGLWENNVRGQNRGRIVFKTNGEVVFSNGFEFYNPAYWEWDAMQKRLILRLPQAPDAKLDIFKMYVGDGVQSFDRQRKEVAYRFDEQTTSLNIGGWNYSKIDTTKPTIPAEPTLR